MNKLNILFISDDHDLFTQLTQWSNSLPLLIEWEFCSNPEIAKNNILHQNFNVLFFYFNQENQNKYETVFDLNDYYIQVPKVVLLEKEVVLEKIEQVTQFTLTDLMIAPLQHDRFLVSLHRSLQAVYRTHNESKNDTIFIKIGRKLVKFLTSEIEYIEADGPYSRVIYHQQIHLVNEKISHMEARLPMDKFIRIHKSFIISLDKVTEIDKRNINIGKKKIPIGSTYKHKLHGFFKLLDE